MQSFRFLDWNVYQEAQSLFLDLRNITQTLSPDIRRDIGSQTIRASLSVVLNIAEGSGKSSEKEFIRFLDISFGSLYETRAILDSLFILEQISQQRLSELVLKLESIGRQIGGLKRKARGRVIKKGNE